MIKKIVTVSTCLCLFLVMAIGQNLPIHEKSGKVAFIEVFDAPNMTAAELFDVVKEWSKKQKNWVLVSETAGSEIVFAGKKLVYYKSPVGGSDQNGNVDYEFTLFTKEGRVRYVATNFVHTGNGKAPDAGKLENADPDCGRGKMVGSSWAKIKNKTKVHIEELAIDLKKYVKAAQADPTKDDNW